MILADSSIWVGHLRSANARLAALLERGEVLIHPLVIGELACGNIRNRAEVLRMLGRLPGAPAATDAEALLFIERHAIMGRGVGYVDVHLLAATVLAEGSRLWTDDCADRSRRRPAVRELRSQPLRFMARNRATRPRKPKSRTSP